MENSIHNDTNDLSSNDMSNMDFYSKKIGEHICNINRKDNLVLLQNFGNMIPYYDDDNGLYLKLNSANSNSNDANISNNDQTIVKLKGYVASNMLIKNSKNMTYEEYCPIFVERKKEFLEETLIKQSYAKGYEFPSAVQNIAVPELIMGNDALVQFKSGTGKTHAFLCGCLWGFDPYDDALQYVFITSSHEVAIQIYEQSKFLLQKTARIALCIGQKKDVNSQHTGGFKMPTNTSNLGAQPKTLREEKKEMENAQIIVCTIGKFYDFYCNRKWISTEYLKAICIDEFDAIVSRTNFRSDGMPNTDEQVSAIIRNIPRSAQRIFFSATVSESALKIAQSYFRDDTNPFIVLLDIEDYTLDGIKQYYVVCDSFGQKKEVLLDLIKQCRISKGIIFTNEIKTANELKYLLDNEFKNFLDGQESQNSSAVFHGGLSAINRKNIHSDFLNNKIRLLISTDVASRGLDVQGINVVINFDMPQYLQTYIHRVGRSGRFGRKGIAISLITSNKNNDEMCYIEQINTFSKNSKMLTLPEDLSNLL